MNYEDIKEIKSMSPQKLAFFGDAVFELMIRKRILFEKVGHIGELNTLKNKNVSTQNHKINSRTRPSLCALLVYM